MKRRARRLVLRSERLALMRRMLIEALGGCCVDCGAKRRLEIDHVHGCAWVHRRATQETRIRRYADEFRCGVEPAVRCRSHNGAGNQHVHGTRSERSPLTDAVERIEETEREAA